MAISIASPWCSAIYAQSLVLPARTTNALTGSEFAQQVATLDLAAREQEVCSQILSGNVPDFLRKLCPVQIASVAGGKTNTATFYVTADYLAVGSDADYLLVPISPYTAQKLADALHCSLPTRKMVDAIYTAADVKLPPRPIAPGPAMTTVAVFSNHNALVRAQRAEQLAAHPLGALVAGHKKDVVISARLASAPGKVAIYGWHQTNGAPIQPLYLGHTAAWVDYSQCTRLVQQALEVNGHSNTVAAVLADPSLAGLLSDEGVVSEPTYPTSAGAAGKSRGARDATNSPAGASTLRFVPSGAFNERVASLTFDNGVKIAINAPAHERFTPGKKVLLIFYALPNGNTTEQTIGKVVKPGDDWHFGIQHIGAQTRFLRELLTDRLIVVAYFENTLKSWPAWRKKYGDQQIPELVAAVTKSLDWPDVEIALTAHSGGGSLIFGYLNAVDRIPENIVRIAFLDSNYAYDRASGHLKKLAAWLKSTTQPCLCVLAYNDAVALLDGKSFVSAAGGTWGKSHEMQHDLAETFDFTSLTNADFQQFTALNGRVQFILKENPERKIFHTVQVERNGFIHALLTGTPNENKGYEYFGSPVYLKWVY